MDDTTFLSSFESGTLPRMEWTHRAHIRMAFLYCRDMPPLSQLIRLVRERIIAYNLACGNPTGYHETITVAFLRLVLDRLHHHRTYAFVDFERDNSDLFEKGGAILSRYYESTTLFSPEAREKFVEPDRAPLPEIVLRTV